MKQQPRSLLIVICALVFIVTAFAAALPGESQPAHFKNLKVLPKNISDKELDKIMDNFNFALGVNCNFCHEKKKTTGTPYDYVSDLKPEKEIARNMMRMTNDINKKYFNFSKQKIVPETVTCITCHQKKSIPVSDTMPFIKRG